MLRTRLVGPLWRWHRRLGLAAALLVLLLAVSGLLLNHAPDLGLDRAAVGSAWLRSLYGDDSRTVQAFAVDAHWVGQGAGATLFLDERAIGACEGRLVGALVWGGTIVAACEHELLLLSPGGESIDSLGSASGLSDRIAGLARGEEVPLVQAGGQWRRFDIEQMTLGGAEEPRAKVEPQLPPEQILSRLQQGGGWLTWERVLLDLHSGRAFGRFGMLAMDAAAVLSIVLALSGVTIWALHRRSRKS